jgi:F-type H+-transporting ATPase subunit b
MLELNPGLILWTIITFVVVLVILRVAAWKPLVGALTAREEGIKASLQQAEQARRDAHELLEENKRQLAKAEENAQQMIRQGRELGDRLKSEIIDKANTSAQHMIAQAREEIGREKEAALTALRAEVADLAIAAAGKLIDANLDTPKQHKLVESAINEITKA